MPTAPMEEPFDGVAIDQFAAPPNFIADSEAFLEEAEKKEENELDIKKLRDLVPVDTVG